jgi:hypothetical protein
MIQNQSRETGMVLVAILITPPKKCDKKVEEKISMKLSKN